MSVFDSRLGSFASPWRARSLLTVRAAISSALSSDLPRSSRLSLMCSYCRSRFGLAPLGMAPPLVGVAPGGVPEEDRGTPHDDRNEEDAMTEMDVTPEVVADESVDVGVETP